MNREDADTPAGEKPRSSFWLCCLLVYWLLLLVGTHLPPTPTDPPLPGPTDKLVHLAAYAGLAYLMACWLESVRGGLGWRLLLLVWAACTLFGALDELTQQLVGRKCSFADWVADAGGAALGVLLFHWSRAWLGRSRSASSIGPPNS